MVHMPELPDIEAYLSALRPRLTGRALNAISLASPFFVRTVEPPIESLQGDRVTSLNRLGKRIVIAFDSDRYLVIHLLIAGRLRWSKPGAKPVARIGLAALDFDTGSLQITEAGNKRRASLHVVDGQTALNGYNPGGIEPMTCTVAQFEAVLRRENHTLKRSLTDPRLIAGIGNAYSDEILHAARLSPLKLTGKLTAVEIERLHGAMRDILQRWTARLSEQFNQQFPGAGDVTAFRDDFAAHGRFNLPCPDCGTPIQRIRYADNETNYCPTCQNEGRILADRSLSRLLRDDWPKTVDEL